MITDIRTALRTEFPEFFKDNKSEEFLDFVTDLVDDIMENCFNEGYDQGYSVGYEDAEFTDEGDTETHQEYMHCLICKQLSYRLIDKVCYYCR